MSKISLIPLTHLAVISVQGKDAVKFLQGQCTQDIALVEKGQDCPGAFCTPKGRTVANVWLHTNTSKPQQIDMICAASVAPVLHKHLAKYIPFFRGTHMIVQEHLSFYGSLNPDTPLEGDHQRVVVSENMMLQYGAQVVTDVDSPVKWLTAEIAAGLLWLSADQSEQWIPQNINLDTGQAISFNKGCYTGQEVVARLHYKGDSKKRLFSIVVDGIQTLEHLFQQGKNIGTVLQQAVAHDKTYALAVINKNGVNDTFFIDENEQVRAELLN